MRRKDREVTDNVDILEIIEKCDTCRLGLSKDNIPYVVPMNFGYEYIDNKFIFYFHGAKEGKKHDIMKENTYACIEMDCSHRLVSDELGERYTMEYESVIAYGNIEVCETYEQKRNALNVIMKHYEKERTFDFSEKMFDVTKLFKLEVTEVTAKRNIKNTY